MLNSCKSISIALKVTSNLNTTKGRACAKEPGITSRQRQALEVCSLAKRKHNKTDKVKKQGSLK